MNKEVGRATHNLWKPYLWKPYLFGPQCMPMNCFAPKYKFPLRTPEMDGFFACKYPKKE
jgi:hypothetical protein